jgi:hypothetical protein
MKGEKLPPLSRWYGVPTQPMPARAAPETVAAPPVVPSPGSGTQWQPAPSPAR